MAARCAHCGEALRPHSMFCLSCGQLVAQGPPPAQAPTVEITTSTATPPPSTPVPVSPPPPPVGPARAKVPVANNRPSTFVLRFSTGVTINLTDEVLVGRNPTAAAASEGITGLVVDDDERSVSRVHAHLQAVGAELYVTDRGSGNGTRIERGGATIPCPGGKPTPARAGDRIWVGSVYCNVLLDDSL